MKIILYFIGLILAIWLLAAIITCDGTIPYCLGESIKSGFMDGISS